MRCGWAGVKQWGQKLHTSQRDTATECRAHMRLSHSCTLHARKWTTVEVRDLAHRGHAHWKTMIEFGSLCNVFYLFIFFVYIEGTKLPPPPHFFFFFFFFFIKLRGLVLVYDNKVVYLLGYAPVSSFCDPPSPFKMSSWMVKNPAPSFY